MWHRASDIPPLDPAEKKWRFHEAGACEHMNGAELPFELNLFGRGAGPISPRRRCVLSRDVSCVTAGGAGREVTTPVRRRPWSTGSKTRRRT